MFAVLDKEQVIRSYDCYKGPLFLCDNKNDIDCTKARCDFTVMSWQDELLALGEDGFLHFWTLSSKSIPPFAAKKRNSLSEKLFYTKKQLVLGAGQSLHQNWTEIHTDLQRQMDALGTKLALLGNVSSQTVDLLEGRIKKAVCLGEDMLSRLQQNEEPWPASEVREFVENYLEVLTTIDD